MTRLATRKNWVVLVVTLGVWATDSARGADCGDGVLTMVQGGPVTRSVRGKDAQTVSIDAAALAFLVGKDDHRWKRSETLQTGAGTTATVLFPSCNLVVRLGADTEALLTAPHPDVALQVRLLRGEAVVWGPTDANAWSLVAMGDAAYALVRRGAIRVVSPRNVELLRGEAGVFNGPVPQRRLIEDDGRLAVRPDAALSAPALQAVTAGFRSDALGAAVAAGDGWIAEAEQGDLIPARGPQRGPTPLPAEGGVHIDYYQPRSGTLVSAVALASREGTTGGQRENIVQSLSRQRDAAVAVAARLERTRIIGAGFGETGVTTGGILLRTNELVRLLTLNGP
jgi:hypothetical protein